MKVLKVQKRNGEDIQLTCRFMYESTDTRTPDEVTRIRKNLIVKKYITRDIHSF